MVRRSSGLGFLYLFSLCTACAKVGSVRGEKVAMITHILGPVGRANLACIHASAEAKAAADTLRLLSNGEGWVRRFLGWATLDQYIDCSEKLGSKRTVASTAFRG
jgi:hypothetical protein